MIRINAKSKVYISGPMTGYPKFNAVAFAKAARSLRKRGHKVVSPPEEDKKLDLDPTDKDIFWKACLKRDLKDLLDCDAVHTLEGWERSKGATLEIMVAKELGLKFVDIKGNVVESVRATHESILVEAERLTNGPRRKTYGHPKFNFTTTGRIWAAILGLEEVTPIQVGLCMVGVKLAREKHVHTRDNLVDVAGYINTVDMIHQADSENAMEAMRDRANG